MIESFTNYEIFEGQFYEDKLNCIGRHIDGIKGFIRMGRYQSGKMKGWGSIYRNGGIVEGNFRARTALEESNIIGKEVKSQFMSPTSV